MAPTEPMAQSGESLPTRQQANRMGGVMVAGYFWN